MPHSVLPDGHAARDRFVTSLRPSRPVHDPWQSHAVVLEHEPTGTGAIARVATVFLTGRECPWRCVMCDLWQYTTVADTPPGAIAAQTMAAREWLATAHPDVTRIKLYNAGSFFDSRAVPEQDYGAVAAAVARYDRVIVESHPALIGPRTRTFLAALLQHRDSSTMEGPVLEVAMGLETVHPVALDRINKRMSVEDFTRAASTLADMNVALRVFLLVAPPFIAPADQDEWLMRSIDTALACGATAVSLIPTRPGNGAIDQLASDGAFTPPHLRDLERVFALALARLRPAGARVFADIWDLERFASCPHCLPERRDRLRTMNLEQRPQPAVVCTHCEEDDDR
jgi:radical SAM enzyme (TIGR01210 family)